MRKVLLVLIAVLISPALRAADAQVPTIDQVIALQRPGAVAISPDGTRVAYTVSETNWDDNAYETQIFLTRRGGGPPVQLTRSKKSSSAPAWSPDGRWIVFISDRTDKRQLYLISPDGGEARPLTDVDGGVGSFAWSPDGSQIALTMTDPVTDAAKERDKRYGAFEIVDEEYRMTHLHVIGVDPAASTPAAPRRLTQGDFTVGSFNWSPDSASIAFDHRVDPNANNAHTADISVLTVADGTVRKLVTQPGPDSRPVWSPDGRQIAFQSAMQNEWFYYSNNRIAVIPAAGGAIRSITDAFDEQPSLIDWAPSGILFSGLERASSHVYRLDPATGEFTALNPAGATAGGFSFSRDFSAVAFVSGDAQRFPEVHAGQAASMASASTLTSFGDQIKGWTVGNREMISWKSSDGEIIEGVLHKPADFQPGRRYPLLVVVPCGCRWGACIPWSSGWRRGRSSSSRTIAAARAMASASVH
jgi:dipeptidyl aminopeptidase/acylaminoacyl peptidase